MVSLGDAFVIAAPIVRHAVAAPGARQVLASLPAVSTYQGPAARAGCTNPAVSTTTAHSKISRLPA